MNPPKLNLLKKGFTFVELMVVIAIIGILSAIAIPDYSASQAKARQIEAKMALSAIFTGEAAYYSANQTYTTCLDKIGVTPLSGANTFYTVGFSTNSSGLSCTPYYLANSTASSRPSTYTDLPPSTASSTAFTAGAAGLTSKSTIDSWTIDNNYTLVNTAVPFPQGNYQYCILWRGNKVCFPTLDYIINFILNAGII